MFKPVRSFASLGHAHLSAGSIGLAYSLRSKPRATGQSSRAIDAGEHHRHDRWTLRSLAIPPSKPAYVFPIAAVTVGTHYAAFRTVYGDIPFCVLEGEIRSMLNHESRI